MSQENNIIIVGAGLSGIAMACQLQRTLNFYNFEIYEKSDKIGGTWYVNDYPGCACDVPSHLYSYSFEKNPDWSQVLPSQSEILDYIIKVWEKYKLPERTHMNTECLGADWDQESERWTVNLKDLKTGKTYSKTCKFLIMGAGVLSTPNPCPVPGIEKFKGDTWHSATWNHKVDLKDKDVVVIGNGCSATQFVPVILPQVKSLTQCVRSSHWLFPRLNFKYSDRFKWIMRYVPGAMTFYRLYIAYYYESNFRIFRTEAGRKLREYFAERGEYYMRRKAPEKYHDILIPKYQVGAKRRVLDSDYLKCLHDPKILLTNDPLVEVKEKSVLTKSGKEYPADVIICANGFKVHELFLPMVIKGKTGEDIRSRWKRLGGARAYMGVMVAGYPNMFIMVGPNTASGHYSIIFMSECNANLIIKLIKPLLKNGKHGYIEVTEEAEKRDVDWVQSKLKECIWGVDGEGGWYVDKNTGHNGVTYPHFQTHYWLRSLKPNWNDFNIVGAKPKNNLGLVLLFIALFGILISWLLTGKQA